MALIAPQAAGFGTAVTYATVGASDTFRPSDRGVLNFRTAGTGATITFVIPGNDKFGVAREDRVVTMAATENRAVYTGLFVEFADPTTGLVTYTTSSQTAHTVAYQTF